MRNIKQLLSILLDNVDQINCLSYSPWGLCELIIKLHTEWTITDEEKDVLVTYLYSNIPHEEDYDSFLKKRYSYWFPKGEAAPRREWLTKEIAKL